MWPNPQDFIFWAVNVATEVIADFINADKKI